MASVGDVWIVDFGDPFPGEPAHHRPALVLGPAEVFPAGLPFVLVAPFTTVKRGISLHLEVEPDGRNGLDDVSYLQCEMIRSVSRRRLVHRMGAVGPDVGARAQDVVRVLLGL
jgi:mRNA interferase MazF